MPVDVQEMAKRVRLVVLNSKVPTFRKRHASASADVNAQHGTDDEASVSVKFCNHPALTRMRSIASELYINHIALTMPSVQKKTRLIMAGKEFAHWDMILTARDKFAPHVDAFMGDYEQLKREAPSRLNGLYDERAWPSMDVMREKFGLHATYLPCPHDGEWAKWLEESARAIVSHISDTLCEKIEHCAKKCAGGRLYKTVFTSLRDIIDDIPDFVFEDSDDMRDIVNAIEPLSKLDAEILRDDPAARMDVHNKANKILDMFGGIDSLS